MDSHIYSVSLCLPLFHHSSHFNSGEYRELDHIRVCDGPSFQCGDAPNSAECESMKEQFQRDPSRADLWKTMRVTGSAYETCVKLQQCPNEAASATPALGGGAPDTDSLPACLRAFSTDGGCRIDPTCSAIKVCTSACYTCVRLVQDWPIFMETCSPPNANINDEAEVPNPGVVVPASSFAEDSSSSSSSNSMEMESDASLTAEDRAFIEAAAQGRAEFNAATADRARRIQNLIQSGAIPSSHLQQVAESAAAGTIFSINPDLPNSFGDSGIFMELATTIQSAIKTSSSSTSKTSSAVSPAADVRGGVDRETIQKACYAKYFELAESRRARYFMSYKRSNMPALNPDDLAQSLAWDAHSTCKCLKAGCPMQPGETMSMLGTCQYNRMHEMIMKIAFPNVANP